MSNTTNDKQTNPQSTQTQGPPEERLPGIVLLSGVVLLFVLVFGLFATGVNPQATNVPQDADVTSGEWTLRYQTRFEEGLVIQEPATHLWALFRFTLFGQGRDGVLVGDDGWLFTNEEFVYHPGEEARIERWIDYVEAVRDTLAARDIELVIALVPAKARLYEQRLGRYTYPDYAKARDDRFREGILELGIAVPDLAVALSETQDDAESFLRTDTHWSPDGALAAARALGPGIIDALERKRSPRTTYQHSRGSVVRHEGDLLTFIPLGPFADRFGPAQDTLRTLVASPVSEESAADESVGLFEEVRIPVTLVGTSYSAGELWGFAEAIKSVVDADVLNVATRGEGPFVPMAEWLGSPSIEETTPDVVVWEIPERYLPVDYSVEFPDD